MNRSRASSAFPTELHVLDGGALTLVQDRGRWEHTHLGVPVSGPMDPFAFDAANALVGNDVGAAALELTAVGPRVVVDGDCFVAITGGDLGPLINGHPVTSWRPHLAVAGSEISFGGRRSGARAYLAVSGGIAVDPWLGSRSTYLRGGVGGFRGRALRSGDRIPVGGVGTSIVRVPLDGLREADRPGYSSTPTLRVIMGPHLDRFADEGVATFLSGEYLVTERSDRQGYRLAGPAVAHRGSADVSSCGLPFGAVQVPGNGMPILLMADHQTTGGYPVIGVVIRADLPLAAQCLPGDVLRFRATDAAEARASLREQVGVLGGVGPPLAQR